VFRNSLVIFALLVSAACENPSPLDMRGKTPALPGPTPAEASDPHANPLTPSAKPGQQWIDLDSKDILARTDAAGSAEVKHVLVAWKELASAYPRGRMDPRAKARSNDDAAKMAKDIADQLGQHPEKIDDLVSQYGEDPGAKSGEPYHIDSNAGFAPDFQRLALRLKMNEVGICHTPFGYHVVERVAPTPPDPLESADILARPAQTGPNWVQHILVSWKDAPAVKAGQLPPDAKRDARSKADADAMMKDAFAKLKGGADMAGLMKQLSEDPGSKDDGSPYKVSAQAQLVEPFKALGLRLEMGEYGMVKSQFGWHLMKRVPQPPPDPLDSVEILKREPADHVKIKHLLVGYAKHHSSDPRGQSRSREDLDKLVKDTVAKLSGGASIDPMMESLSEDGASRTKRAFDITAKTPAPDNLKDLALRLKVGEVGSVMTEFGVYIVQRVE
jgi:parvulin-like peptidyl-prolyl isomerase